MNLSILDTPLSNASSHAFASGQPFPLIVIDDFLPSAVADALIDEIGQQHQFQRSNDYIFAKNKFELPGIAAMGPAAAALNSLLLSPEFATSLSALCGMQLHVDPEFVGGGLHRGGEGSFLDMHVDFSRHPRQKTWVRELNILLYLNRNWQAKFGGQLDLRNANTGATRSVEPIFNRLVIMLTKGFTFHGYKSIKFPKGSFRTSIAAYAYSTAEAGVDLSALRTTTVWAPEDGGLAKSAIAKVVPSLVTIKQRLFGSATARKGNCKK